MNIAEVSKRYDLTSNTLRYYERIGLLPDVARNKSGIRDYSEDDCRWIEFIKCMRNAGMPIELLVEYVTLFKQGDVTIDARKELLVEQLDQLDVKIAELQSIRARLNDKIKNYGSIVKCEQELTNENEQTRGSVNGPFSCT